MKDIEGGIHPFEMEKLKKEGSKLLYPNSEGVFELYDDKYDLTLHFRTEEEQHEFMQKVKEALEDPEDIIKFSLKNYVEELRESGAESVRNEFTTLEYPGLRFFCGVTKKIDESLGYWKEKDVLPGVFAECSKCGFEIYSEKEKTNFCPSCGAEMSGEEDE